MKYVLEFRETGSRKATMLAYTNPVSREMALKALMEGMGSRDDLTFRLYSEPADEEDEKENTPLGSPEPRSPAKHDAHRGLNEAERRMLERGEAPPRFEEILSVED